MASNSRQPDVKWLIPAVGQDDVFDVWAGGTEFGDWEVVVPIVQNLDPQSVVKSFHARLVSAIRGRVVWLVGTGDAAHLCVDLLTRARSGRCALIDPPVALLLPLEEQAADFEAGMDRVADLDVLRQSLEEVTWAQGLGYSEEERLRILISALEEGDLPGDEQTQAEIRATLSASRQSFDRGSGLESAKLEPWWEAALKLGVDRPVGAWFSSGSRVPDLLPVSRTELTGWSPVWWQSSGAEAAGALRKYFE